MARYHFEKVRKDKKDALLNEFYKAVTLLETLDETRAFFKDILSPQETTVIVRRLQIAEMLDAGFTYPEIQAILKVAKATIARVQNWLRFGCGGYKTMIVKLREVQKIASKKAGKDIEAMDYFSAESIKRRYASYYWPEKMLDQIVDQLDRSIRKRKKFKSISSSIVQTIEPVKRKGED